MTRYRTCTPAAVPPSRPFSRCSSAARPGRAVPGSGAHGRVGDGRRRDEPDGAALVMDDALAGGHAPLADVPARLYADVLAVRLASQVDGVVGVDEAQP